MEMENIVVLLTVINYEIYDLWASSNYIDYANNIFMELIKTETPEELLSYFKSHMSLIKLGE